MLESRGMCFRGVRGLNAPVSGVGRMGGGWRSVEGMELFIADCKWFLENFWGTEGSAYPRLFFAAGMSISASGHETVTITFI